MTLKMQLIEKERGKKIDEILIELFQQYGNVYLVASELGVSQSTVSTWLMRLGMEIRSIVVRKGEVQS